MTGALVDWLMVGGGLGLLLVAGDALVRGAVNLSLRLGVPALIVSLTIVAFGTSAPEMLVSVQAVLENAPGIALGNVVGSNIANVMLVLGLPAIMATVYSSECNTVQSYLQMLAATILFILLCMVGRLNWASGAVLLAALSLILVHAVLVARRARQGVPDLEGAAPDMPWPKVLGFLGAGLLGLPLGAHLLVEGSVDIAHDYGVSETVIGLTLVAIGTSLPEVATSIMAARRGQAEVFLGNVIGSNTFNLLGIMGVASLVGPIPVDATFLDRNLWVMLGAALLLVPFVFLRQNITRRWGVALLALYGAYLVALTG
ncbi:MAG: calcium/sodium antiporter [Paracoccaceae bacterium]|nr:calcium/sodium antiporter [Paracoccaceae bacterium]